MFPEGCKLDGLIFELQPPQYHQHFIRSKSRSLRMGDSPVRFVITIERVWTYRPASGLTAAINSYAARVVAAGTEHRRN